MANFIAFPSRQDPNWMLGLYRTTHARRSAARRQGDEAQRAGTSEHASEEPYTFVVSTSRSLEGREHGVATEVYAPCRGRRIMRDLRRSRWGIASGRRAPWYRRRRPPASLPTAPCRFA